MLLRIPLALEVSGDDVTDAAWDAGWDLVELGVGDEREAQIDVYETASGVTIAHVIDPVVQLQYLVVEGDEVGAIVAEARRRLAWYDSADIRRMWDEAQTLDDRLAAVYIAGVSASASRDETWRVVNAALGHKNPILRQAGIVATTYTQWAEWKFVLSELAEEDADVHVVTDARFALLGIDQSRQDGEPAY